MRGVRYDMNIKSIEPTPSPNTMKINLDEVLSGGKSNNYTKKNAEVPEVVQDILKVEGVKGVYHVADFLAVERNAKYDWKQILPQVRALFGEDLQSNSEQHKMNEHFGEVNVSVQMFKNVPTQVKLTDGNEEKRFGLPERFAKAVAELQSFSDNVVLERKWKEQGVRYGELAAIGDEVVEELATKISSRKINSPCS